MEILDNNNDDEEEEEEEIFVEESQLKSNEYVLNVAFLSFFLFMVLEGIFAIIANSQSMLADALAMSVDAFTYLFNLVAERMKHKSKWLGPSSISAEERKRHRKLVRLYLEFIPPLISVTALVWVSAQAFLEATSTIINDPVEEADAPNVMIMLVFSALNLLLDLLNMFYFSKAERFTVASIPIISGYSTSMKISTKMQTDEENDICFISEAFTRYPSSIVIDGAVIPMDDLVIEDDVIQVDDENSELMSRSVTSSYGSNYHFLGLQDVEGVSKASTRKKSNKTNDIDPMSIPLDESLGNSFEKCESQTGLTMESDSDGELLNGLNLNMCSAYTHVMADTLRSVAVLVAALIAFLFTKISPAIADASAAIVVSIIIAISLGPLIIGLIETWSEIQELKRDSPQSDISIKSASFLDPFQNLQSFYNS